MDLEFRDFLDQDAPTAEDEYRQLASSAVAFEAAYGRMMLAFLDALRHGAVGPRLIVQRTGSWEYEPALHLLYIDGHGHRTSMRVTVDFKDRALWTEGVPLLHYRLTSEPSWPEGSRGPRDELRTREVHTAYEFVVDAIRKCREGV